MREYKHFLNVFSIFDPCTLSRNQQLTGLLVLRKFGGASIKFYTIILQSNAVGRGS